MPHVKIFKDLTTAYVITVIVEMEVIALIVAAKLLHHVPPSQNAILQQMIRWGAGVSVGGFIRRQPQTALQNVLKAWRWYK